MSAVLDDIDVVEPVDNLARMIARSPAFQREVQKFTTDSAETRIHRIWAEKPDGLPRPFAVIGIGKYDSEAIAGGGRNQYRLDGTLTWQLAGEMEAPERPQDSLTAFWSWASLVFREVHGLGGFDGYLDIRTATLEQEPVLSHPLRGDVVPWCWCSWIVTYEGYLA